MRRPLILVCNTTINGEQKRQKALEDYAPRQDYMEIARKLGGSIRGYFLVNASWYRAVRLMEKHIKLDLLEAAWAARRLFRHDIMISTSEKIAIPLAALSFFHPLLTTLNGWDSAVRLISLSPFFTFWAVFPCRITAGSLKGSYRQEISYLIIAMGCLSRLLN